VKRRLVVTPEAKAQLNSLYEYLAREASLDFLVPGTCDFSLAPGTMGFFLGAWH
jgi:hypothetical protein